MNPKSRRADTYIRAAELALDCKIKWASNIGCCFALKLSSYKLSYGLRKELEDYFKPKRAVSHDYWFGPRKPENNRNRRINALLLLAAINDVERLP